MALACKFGGSSVADANQIKKVKAILDANVERRFVVVSAPGKRNSQDKKVTDLLYLAYETAKAGLDPSKILLLVRERFEEIIKGLEISIDLNAEFEVINNRIATETSEFAASRGEYLNGKVIAKFLGAKFVDPFDHIFIDDENLLEEERTYTSLANALAGNGSFLIPGFYGQGSQGQVKTFSRGGSDITGAIVARSINAEKYENWTDVSGLLMADPRIVDNPRCIEEVSYTELRELSYMGAQVLHDEAIFPVRALNIPVQIRNTNQPEHPGTFIVSKVKHRVVPIVGIAGKEDFEIVYLQKALMNKEVGFGRKLLGIFEARRISFEHLPSGIDSLSVVVNSKDMEPHRQAILKEIKKVLEPEEVTNFRGIALIAVVGAGMAFHPGIAATVFTALSKEGINVRLIDQGASELNIIIGVEHQDFKGAINAIYKAFIR